MYKDSFDGERTVEMSLMPKLSIPPLVLEKWASRQIFDVKIDAITAWTVISMNKTAIKAPTKPPSEPLNLKVYTTQQVNIGRIQNIKKIQNFKKFQKFQKFSKFFFQSFKNFKISKIVKN